MNHWNFTEKFRSFQTDSILFGRKKKYLFRSFSPKNNMFNRIQGTFPNLQGCSFFISSKTFIQGTWQLETKAISPLKWTFSKPSWQFARTDETRPVCKQKTNPNRKFHKFVTHRRQFGNRSKSTWFKCNEARDAGNGFIQPFHTFWSFHSIASPLGYGSLKNTSTIIVEIKEFCCRFSTPFVYIFRIDLFLIFQHVEWVWNGFGCLNGWANAHSKRLWYVVVVNWNRWSGDADARIYAA